ncbi:unknow [Vibrio parahaemolyticus]|nr:unknow [Vibrio parahaemolyticus]
MSRKRMKAQMQAQRLNSQQKRYRAMSRSPKPYQTAFR